MKFPATKIALLLLWTVSFGVLLTFEDKAAHPLLEFGPAFRWALILSHTALLACVLLVGKRTSAWAALLVVLLFTLSLKLRTPWLGRDAVMLLFVAQIAVLTVAAPRFPVQFKLLVCSLLISFFLAEQVARSIERVQRDRVASLVSKLPDYPRVAVGTSEGGGDIQADVDMEALGQDGPARFKTNQWGFRHDRNIEKTPAEDTFRIIFVGDSVVFGYRTDQKETIAHKLEERLARSRPGRVEVLIARANSPALEVDYVRRKAFAFKPDMIVAGLTIGNDLYSTLRARQPGDVPADPVMLPEMAYSTSEGRTFLLKVHHAYLRWALYRLLWNVVMPYRYPLWDSSPFDVPVFEENNTLGALYTRQPIDVVDKSIAATVDAFAEMKRMCDRNGVSFGVVVFPQAFQADPGLWRMLTFEYALNAGAFDIDEPHARLGSEFRQRDINYFDTLGTLRQEGAPMFFKGEMHLSRRGQDRVAKALTDWILSVSPQPS